MNNDIHYRSTNTLRDTQLHDHLTKTFHHEIVKFVFKHHLSTVADDDKLSIPEIQRIDMFLCSAYCELCRTSHVPSFTCDHQELKHFANSLPLIHFAAFPIIPVPTAQLRRLQKVSNIGSRPSTSNLSKTWTKSVITARTEEWSILVHPKFQQRMCSHTASPNS